MLKVIGGMIVILASSGLGLSFCEDLRENQRMLKDLRQMMIYIMNRIEASCDSLAEAFIHTAKRVKKPYSLFLENVYQRMIQNEGQNIKELWEEEAVLLNKTVPEKELEILKACMGQTGFSQKNQQMQMIQEYILYLENEIQSVEKTKAEKCKVFQTLGIMAGILMVVILW